MDAHSHTISVADSTPYVSVPPPLATEPSPSSPSPSESLSEGEILSDSEPPNYPEPVRMQPPEPLSPTEQLSDSMTDNDPEPLTTSALARLERHLGSRQPHPSSTGYNYADIDRLSHQAVIDTGRRQIRSTESLGHRVKTLEDAAARTIGGEGLTPKGKLQRKKDIAWTKMELQKRQRMLDTEMKDVKGRLAKAEAKAEKKAVGKGAMDIDNPW